MIRELEGVSVNGSAQSGAILTGDHFRITVLTSSLIRFEYSEKGKFENGITQRVINRNFKVPVFSCYKKDGVLCLDTEHLQLHYDQKEPTANGLRIRILASAMVWHYGDEKGQDAARANLGGTARTLDGIDGAVDIGMGLMSKAGYAVFDDSDSLLIDADGWIVKRTAKEKDLYFFGYGDRYSECLRDLYELTGKTPLLPRFAFGNWWSKYHKYDEKEYKNLMLRFQKEEIPISVAVIDMDWHLVEIDKKYGTGWTGYTWNRDLFPDPPEFIAWLHQHGLKATLNIHPADGIRSYECQYRSMAEEVGIDPDSEQDIAFDMSDHTFVNAYFNQINHPYEEQEGIDFWWIDWQQGTASKMEGLDPLWTLNHYYYLDNARNGKRPLIFSRYAGIGSHRYPVGFSGDSIITWESLDFQPYFTIRAANVGYTWWSHDIGGHMLGVRDDELTARWLQLGCFSPILRLHSNENDFNGKEPWKYNKIAEAVMKNALQTRYRMVPYLYTMNYLTHTAARPIVTPLYFEHPHSQEAYEVKNEFYFGTEMIVCPITSPCDRETCKAKFSAWLPDNDWFDMDTGYHYRGGRKLNIFREIEKIPVFVKAGGILPMDHSEIFDNTLPNPEKLQLRIYAGANGSFDMKEDTGNEIEPQEGMWATTTYQYTWSENSVFKIHPATGNLAAIPAKREYELKFYGIAQCDFEIQVDSQSICAESSYDDYEHILTIVLPRLSVKSSVVVSLKGTRLSRNEKKEHAFHALEKMQTSYADKQTIFDTIVKYGMTKECMVPLHAIEGVKEEVISVICEYIYSDWE